MDKRIRVAAGAFLAGFAVVLAVCVYRGERGGSVDVYELKVPETAGEDSGNVFRFAVDRGTMTYVQEAEIGGETFTLDSGSFSVEEGGIQLYSETDDANSLFAVIDGEYIFAKEYLYEGNIPDSRTFEAVCNYERNGGSGGISFHEDGTYEEITAEGESLRGTYERDGNLIHRMLESGSPELDFYIYEGRITNSFYKK
ncbi:MAG: hypothetical protein NC307_11095 [Roseburia sp.]|nr:hypothetical protein [Roseburia sp.]